MFIIYAKAGKGLGVQGCGGIQKIRQFSMKFDTMGLRNTGFVFSAVVKGTAGVCRGYNMIRMYDAGFRNSGKRGRLSSSLLRAAVAAALGLGLVLGGSAMAADNTAQAAATVWLLVRVAMHQKRKMWLSVKAQRLSTLTGKVKLPVMWLLAMVRLLITMPARVAALLSGIMRKLKIWPVVEKPALPLDRQLIAGIHGLG